MHRLERFTITVASCERTLSLRASSWEIPTGENVTSTCAISLFVADPGEARYCKSTFLGLIDLMFRLKRIPGSATCTKWVIHTCDCIVQTIAITMKKIVHTIVHAIVHAWEILDLSHNHLFLLRYLGAIAQHTWAWLFTFNVLRRTQCYFLCFNVKTWILLFSK